METGSGLAEGETRTSECILPLPLHLSRHEDRAGDGAGASSLTGDGPRTTPRLPDVA
jgi:hypothetical protein